MTDVLDDNLTPSPTEKPAHPLRRRVGRVLAAIGAACFVAFWVWALFFASKEPINRIDDTAWSQRAERTCAAATVEREALANFTKMSEATPELVLQRADIVDHATDILEAMLDDITAVPPTDAKGQDLVPQWEGEYRTYLDDRRAFTAGLRETGTNDAFYETEAGGLPISERLETFAGDNAMPSCAPPRDLTR